MPARHRHRHRHSGGGRRFSGRHVHPEAVGFPSYTENARTREPKTSSHTPYTENTRQKQPRLLHTHMIQELKATYANGVFNPATPGDLDEGTKVVISVTEDANTKTGFHGLESSAGGWKDIVDGEQLIHDIYESRSADSQSQPLPDLA